MNEASAIPSDDSEKDGKKFKKKELKEQLAKKAKEIKEQTKEMLEQEKPPEQLQPMIRLNKDGVAALLAGQSGGPMPSAGVAGASNISEARILVDLYYAMQEYRKGFDNQVGAIERGADQATTHVSADFIGTQIDVLESNAKLFLEVFASSHPMWGWFKAVHGIGPVLAAGLIAHFGSRALPPTVGHWWRFAGLDPSQRWLKADALSDLWNEQEGDIDQRTRNVAAIVGRSPDTVIRDATVDFKTGETKPLTRAGALKSLARIPFNRPLKTLCWKVGDQFVKLGAREDAFYARYYRNRKAQEIARNEAGERAALAAKTLSEKPSHAQRATYADGRLPDGRVDLMARRATVKLFLSHLHEVWWRVEHDGEMPPKPFSVSIQGHAHYIPPPHLDAVGLE
jgi:hypothetical protein